MAEAPPTDATIGAELDLIESSVTAGNTDLAALGFWRLVGRVKPDRLLSDMYADQMGRIDRAAFRARVSLRLPVPAGNFLMLVLAAFGVVSLVVATTTSSETAAGIWLVVAGLVWTVALHCPAHWAVGYLAGIRFTDYFLGGPAPKRPSLKVDYATYLRSDPDSRAWMHAAGAIATKLAPFIALAFWPATVAPWWSAAILGGVGLLMIFTDLAFSVKTGDWKKFLREKAVARARRHAFD